MTVVNPKSISGINSITMASGSDNLLTIHTTNTTERVRVNSDGDVIVGSGITVSPDGDIFATGVTTSTTFVGALTGNVTGNISGGTVAGSTGTFTGDVDIADKIIHTGDTDTAIRFPTADTITFETAATERLRIHTNGNVGIGTIVPANQLHIHGATMASVQYTDAGGGTDTKHWVNVANGTEFYWQATNDAGSGGGNLFKYVRSGNEIQSFEGLQSGATWCTITNQHKQIRLSDNSDLYLGTDLDMSLTHTGAAGVIQNNTGDLYIENDSSSTTEKIYIRPKAGENSIVCEANGAVHLYHDGAATSSYFSRFDGATVRNNGTNAVKHCNLDLFAETGGDANIYFYPDNASNNNHKFRLHGNDGEVFVIQGYITGAYTDFLQCSYASNNTADLRVKVGKGGLKFDNTCEDYRDIDGDGHLFRRDGQAQIGVDDFLYIHDINTSDTSLRLRHRFETNSGNYDAEGTIQGNQNLDFAEYFEWSDGNPSNEDRVGHTVSVDGLTGKIKIAEEGETVIGVISGTACFVCGGQAFSWQGRFKHDEWGREVFEQLKDENGNLLYADAETRAQIVKTNRIETEEYDPSLENSYVPRELRKEWDIVGLLGQIRVRKTAVIPSNWVKLKEIDSVKDLYLVR